MTRVIYKVENEKTISFEKANQRAKELNTKVETVYAEVPTESNIDPVQREKRVTKIRENAK